MAASTPIEELDSEHKSSHCQYTKMKVLSGQESDQINKTVQDNFNEKSIVFLDKSTSYVNIVDHVEIYITEKSTKETTRTTLKWIHITSSNAQRTLLGIFY